MGEEGSVGDGRVLGSFGDDGHEREEVSVELVVSCVGI